MTIALRPCDPSELWVKHQIRWLENGKKGPGWYKLRQSGKAHFYVKLTLKECPICGYVIASAWHPRPTAWLEAEDKKTRDNDFRAADAERALLLMDHVCSACGLAGHVADRCPSRFM